MAFSRITAGRKRTASMPCREGRIPSGVRTREDASQKRFERERGGNCGNESRPTSKEQTEAQSEQRRADGGGRRWNALFHRVSIESVERHTYTIGSFEKGRL